MRPCVQLVSAVHMTVGAWLHGRILIPDVISLDHFPLRSWHCVEENSASGFCRSTNLPDVAARCMSRSRNSNRPIARRSNHTLFAESDTVELVEHGSVRRSRVRALDLGAHAVDVLDGGVELIFMPVGLPQYSLPGSVTHAAPDPPP